MTEEKRNSCWLLCGAVALGIFIATIKGISSRIGPEFLLPDNLLPLLWILRIGSLVFAGYWIHRIIEDDKEAERIGKDC